MNRRAKIKKLRRKVKQEVEEEEIVEQLPHFSRDGVTILALTVGKNYKVKSNQLIVEEIYGICHNNGVMVGVGTLPYGTVLDNIKSAEHYLPIHYQVKPNPQLYVFIHTKSDVQIEQCEQSWPPIITQLPIQNSIMVIGPKNTGKSTLCHYFTNKSDKICLMDCDVGKSQYFPATINLYVFQNHILQHHHTLWIGQYSPMNYSKLYINSIKQLYSIYRSHYFSHPLIINTMGYLTGLGQLLTYQIYDMLQPTTVIYFKKDKNSIVSVLQSGSYKERLTTDTMLHKASIITIHNPHAQSKLHQSKSKQFQRYFNITTIKDLFYIKNTKKINKFRLVYQNKIGNIEEIPCDPAYTDLQLLIVAQCNNNIIKFIGFAYGLNGAVYVKQDLLPLHQPTIIRCQSVQFQKQFYNISQKQLAMLQQLIGYQIPYLLPTYKGLATSGYRNLQHKSHRT